MGGKPGNMVEDMLSKLHLLGNCTETNKGDITCTECAPEFKVLNWWFNGLVVKKGRDNICFDIRDAVSFVLLCRSEFC